MNERPDTKPRKAPIQARAKATVEAMVEAAARILRDEGLEACNTNHIAQVAGVSIGTLYQYFPTREAILASLVERELDADLTFVAQIAPDLMILPLSASLEALLTRMLERFEAPGYLALHAQLLPLVPLLERQGLVRSRVGDTLEGFTALLEARQQELAPRLRGESVEAAGRRRVAAFVAFEAMEATLNAAKVRRQEVLAHPEFAENLLRMVKAVLLDED